MVQQIKETMGSLAAAAQDKAETVGEAAHDVIETIKEINPFSDNGSDRSDSEVEESGPAAHPNGHAESPNGYKKNKANRWYDPETGQWVSNQKALGTVAVAQEVAVANGTEPNGSQHPNGTDSIDKSWISTVSPFNGPLSIKLATEDRYFQRNNPKRIALMEEAKADGGRKDLAEAEAEQALQDAERYREWNVRIAEGQSPDEAFNQAMQRREKETKLSKSHKLDRFTRTSNANVQISKEGKQVLALANQIRLARAKFQHLVDEGVLLVDDKTYDEQVTQRENKLQDLLISYGNDISQEQQDFIIDYSGGAYNELLESPAPSLESGSATDAAEVPSEDSDPTIEDESEVTEGVAEPEVSDLSNDTDRPGEKATPWPLGSNGNINYPIPGPWRSNGERNESLNGSVADLDEKTDEPTGENGTKGVPIDSALVPVAVASGTGEATSEGLEPSDAVAGDSDPTQPDDQERGDRADRLYIDTLLEEANPAFYGDYLKAREKYVNAHANARLTTGLSLIAGLGSLIDRLPNKPWIERLRNSKLGEPFSQSGPDELQMAREEFDPLHKDALEMAFDEYSSEVPMNDDEMHANNILLQANEAKKLDQEITNKLIDTDNDQNKRLSVSRRVATFAGLGIAAVAGGFSAILDGVGKGGSDHPISVAIAAGVSGAASAYGAAKADRSDEQYETFNRQSEVEYRMWNEDITAIDATEEITEAEQKKNIKRIGGMALAGAGVAAFTHYAVEYGSAWIANGIGAAKSISALPGLMTNGFEAAKDIDVSAGMQNVNLRTIDVPGIDLSGVDMPSVNMPDSDSLSNLWDEIWSNDPASEVKTTTPAAEPSVAQTTQPVEIVFPNITEEVTAAMDNLKLPDVSINVQPVEVDVSDVTKDVSGVLENLNSLDPDNINLGEIFDGDPTEATDNAGGGDNLSDSPGVEAEEAGTEIYVEDGSGINRETQQYVETTYGVHLNDHQLKTMYHDLYEVGPHPHKPSDLFDNVKFYPMDNGQQGMRDVGSATINPRGEVVFKDYLIKNNLLKLS